MSAAPRLARGRYAGDVPAPTREHATEPTATSQRGHACPCLAHLLGVAPEHVGHRRPARYRTTRTLVAACGIALFTLLAACSSAGAPAFRSPEPVAAAAKVTERSGEGIVVEFTLVAENRGPEPLPLRTVSYALDIDGRRVFRGVRSAEATVRRYGRQVLTLPAVIPIAPGEPAPTGVRAYALRGEVTYVTPGALAEVLFDAELRQPTTSFRMDGTIDLGAPASASAAR